jgi:hypothetical protein
MHNKQWNQQLLSGASLALGLLVTSCAQHPIHSHSPLDTLPTLVTDYRAARCDKRVHSEQVQHLERDASVGLGVAVLP